MKLSRLIISCSIALIVIITVTLIAEVQSSFRDRIKNKLEKKQASGNSLLKGHVKINLKYNGRSRYYLVHVPSGYDKTKPTPVVFIIHGGGGNPAQIEAQTDFIPFSDRDNFLLVYPAGSSGSFEDILLTWNTGFTDTYADKQNLDDLGFLLKVLEDVSSKYNVDSKRVFTTGMSQGGFMSYRLASEAADKFAAAAPVAGSLNIENCNPNSPISILAFNGLKDGSVLYNGQPSKHVVKPHASAKDAFHFWVKHAGLSGMEAREEKIGNAKLELFGPGKDGVEVGLWTLKDAGHAWPGKKGKRKKSEKTNMDINATEIIWEFFKRHSKP